MSAAAAPVDVTVIGSGPGGYVAAVRAAQLGLSVLVVEKDERLGGVCTLRGCIPTKALLHTADLLDEARRGGEVGVAASAVRLDLAAAHAWKDKVVGQSVRGIGFLMKKNRIEVARGFGSLVGATTVRVTAADGSARDVATRHVILATGSAPRALPGVAFDGERVLSSDHVLELRAVPESMIIVGAGAVGLEFASMYARFGTRCTIVEAQARVAPLEDEEISAEMLRSLRRRGVAVHLAASVERVERDDAGVTVTLAGGETLRAARLLVAIGRRPLTEGLGLEAAGVATTRGFVQVDAYQRTTVPSVFAIGDLVPTAALAHVASAEGVVAAEVIANHPTRPLDADQVPSCTYGEPEIASIGLSEAAARARGLEVRVGRFPFSAVARARILGRTEGLVKVVAGAQGRVLGVHMIGPHVTELVAEAAAAMHAESTAEDLVRTIHAHPTLAEGLHEAFEGVGGHAIHI